MFLTPVAQMKIEDIISSLDSLKSNGPFSIPRNLVKALKRHISYLLEKFINQSFVKGIALFKLIVAKVIPLFKQGDSEIASIRNT